MNIFVPIYIIYYQVLMDVNEYYFLKINKLKEIQVSPLTLQKKSY